MNPSTPVSTAFRAIFWRFPNDVPHPPDLPELELAGRTGTRELLSRFIVATKSPEFQALVAKHHDGHEHLENAAGPLRLANSVNLAIRDLGT